MRSTLRNRVAGVTEDLIVALNAAGSARPLLVKGSSGGQEHGQVARTLYGKAGWAHSRPTAGVQT